LTFVAAVLIVLSFLSLLTLVVAIRAPFTWRRCVVRRRVIVNLRSGSAISGVLVAQRGQLLFLRDATLHEQGQRVAIDGEALVERGQVDWIQAVTPAGA
jgi:small nuclear ribonucleoprotein (snRNP)-like protein